MSLLLNKTNRFHFAMGLYSDNPQRTSKSGKNISHKCYSPAARSVLVCSYHFLTSSVRYQSKDARRNEIYLNIMQYKDFNSALYFEVQVRPCEPSGSDFARPYMELINFT